MTESARRRETIAYDDVFPRQAQVSVLAMIKLKEQSSTYSSTIVPPLVNRQRAWVEINLQALAHNVRQIKRLLNPPTELMAVVKADAYGHGATAVAEVALNHGANSLAIATLTEGVELRQGGITAPILILGAINDSEDIKELAYWQLEPTICDVQQALVFSKTLSEIGLSLRVHLKLDTGMSRLGTHWQDAAKFATKVQKLPNLSISSVYSHFATADDPDTTMMNLQAQRFERAIAKIKAKGIVIPRLHLANSAAALRGSSYHYDLVRIGLALYGLYPAPHLKRKIELQPVLQVKAKITQVKTITAGTGVSYGHRFVAAKNTKIAIVSIGYADGVPRNLSNHLQAIVRGQLVPQIGAITMDQLILDVNELADVQPGEIVTLIGKDAEQEITADHWANSLNTISWEIICGFKHRLPRININKS